MLSDGSSDCADTATVASSRERDNISFFISVGFINAKIENIEKTNLTEEQQKYITFTVKYKENDTELKIGDILSKKEVKPLTILIGLAFFGIFGSWIGIF